MSKMLIPANEFGIFVDNHDTARISSLDVAKMFDKMHKHVIRDIENLDCSEEFRKTNFGRSSYKSEQNKKMPCYDMTRDGFMFLVMGYRGKKASAIKEMYIKRFNDMEKFIHTLVTTRKDFPLLTDNIKLLHENPKPYHFSNECDMINKLVTGMTAKKFREAHNIPKGESIRPYLTDKQIELMEKLQKADVGLLIAFPNYEDRKRHLEWYMLQLEKNVA